MQRLLILIGIEGYAVLLALFRSLGAVHTDEAKYLLNIPYPHPPLAREILHFTEMVPHQEMMWRVIFASLLVQSVWMVARMAKGFSTEDRLTLCGLWLFCASVLFQSGTVMMAVLTAVQGMVFVYLLMEMHCTSNVQGLTSGKHKTLDIRRLPGWIALFWLMSLFTAYQAVLYLPIVIAIFWKSKTSVVRSALAIGIPLALLVLYVASNPLAAASFIAAGEQNTGQPLVDLLQITATSWLWAGSGVLSIVGLLGMINAKHWPLLLSFVLVCAFHVTSYREYYPVLFLPLLVGGVIASPRVLKRSSTLLAMQIVIAVYVFAHTQLALYETNARAVMRQVNQLPSEGVVLISGSFSHSWQYESTSPILRYRPSLLSKAKAVVCLDACPGVSDYGFYQIQNIGQEVWVSMVELGGIEPQLRAW